MNEKHPILRRQVKRILSGASHSCAALPGVDLGAEPWCSFLSAVDQTYFEFESSRKAVVRALEISSLELERANSDLRGVVEALPDLLFQVNPENRIVTLTRRELAGFGCLALDEYLASVSRRGIAVEFWRVLESVRREQQARSFEFADSIERVAFFVEARMAPHGDGGVVGMLRDITERRNAETALRRSEENARRSEAELRKVKEDLEMEREKLRVLATLDGLTGIWNRRAAFDYLRSEFQCASAGDYPLSVILIDLDHFKHINDTYGHLAGDATLQEFARRLQASVRGTDRIGRFGGEEFLVLLSDVDGEAACRRAEEIRAAVEAQPIIVGIDRIALTCSVGVSWNGPFDQDPSHLVRRADVALYRAKREGRNRIASESPACNGTADSESDLLEAVPVS